MTERVKTVIELAVHELLKRGGHLTFNSANRAMMVSCTDGGANKQFYFEARALDTCANCQEDLYAEFETPAPTEESKLTLKKIRQAMLATAVRGDTELLAIREFKEKLYFALGSQDHGQGWKTGECGSLCLPAGPASAVAALRLAVDLLATHEKKLREATAKVQDRALLSLRQIPPERLMEGLLRVADASFPTLVLSEYLRRANSPLDNAPPLFLMKLDQLRPGGGQDIHRIQCLVGILQEAVAAAQSVKTLTSGAPRLSLSQAT